LQGLEAAVIERDVRLVVVDSIAALARADFGASQLPERQQALGAHAPPRTLQVLRMEPLLSCRSLRRLINETAQ